MVGSSYGRGITPELAQRLGVLSAAEGFVSGHPSPDSPLKALRAADVPEMDWKKLAQKALSGSEEDEDETEESAEHVLPKVSAPCKLTILQQLLSIITSILSEKSPNLGMSGQFRPPDSGQFRS